MSVYDYPDRSIPWLDGFYAQGETEEITPERICPYDLQMQWYSAQEWIDGFNYRIDQEENNVHS